MFIIGYWLLVMTEICECVNQYPVELFLDEYNEYFNKVSLPFSLFGYEYERERERNLLSQQIMFIKWLFNDMVYFMLDKYENWKKLRIENDNINSYLDTENVQVCEVNYDLKARITQYFSPNKNEMKKIQYIYRRCIFDVINQRFTDRMNLYELFELLFNNYKNKVGTLGLRHYIQHIDCSMDDSYGEIITFSLTIYRDYWSLANNHLIQKYIDIDGTFECIYYNKFKAWYEKLVEMTNHFDKDTIGYYLYSRINEDMDDVEQIFKIPYHGNQILVEYMIKLFNLKDIQEMKFVFKTKDKIIERTHLLVGPNINIQNYNDWSDEWCIVQIIEFY
jgi:hypothetical protein